jgi:hypothetical protein
VSMDEGTLVLAAFAGKVWDAARQLDAEYTLETDKVPWAELSEDHKIEFMRRTEVLVNPILSAYAATGRDNG